MTAALILTHLAALVAGLLLGRLVKANARYGGGVRAGRAQAELEHGWHPAVADGHGTHLQPPTRRNWPMADRFPKRLRRTAYPNSLVYRPAEPRSGLNDR